MEFSTFPLLLLTLIIVTISAPKLVSAQFSSFAYKACGTATYKSNSTYRSNLKSLLNSLSNDTRDTHGYHNFTVGHDPDRLSGYILCRGDVPANTCRGCAQNAASLITTSDNCPNQKQAFGYSGYCTIFYSNGSTRGEIQDVVPWLVTNSNAISNAGTFNKSLNSLMSKLQNKAASGDSTLKYATGDASFSGGQTVYGLVQCTPDLSKQSCIDCLQGSLSFFPSCCIKPKFKASGVSITQPKCFVRYELYNFSGNVPDIPLSSPPTALSSNQTHSINSSPPTGKRKSRIMTVVSVSLGVSAILLIALVYTIILRKKRLRNSWMVKFSSKDFWSDI